MMHRGVRILSIGLASFLAATAVWGVDLTFNERVAAEMALEEVRLRHRGSPADLELSREVFESRVRRQLAESIALETVWNTPLTEAMLDAELRRMIKRSRLPNRLREYFAALGDDPLLIGEALARPVLVRHLTRSFFRNDRAIHAGGRARIERIREALADGRLDPTLEHPLRFVVDQADAVGFVAESAEGFHTDATFTDDEGQPLVARYVVRKLTWDEWWRGVAASMDIVRAGTIANASPSATLSAFLAENPLGTDGAATACDFGTWGNTSLDDVPDPRQRPTAVWTGSEMIVWGGFNGSITLGNGGRYDPAIDHWEPLSNDRAPLQRHHHTAVWTGTTMIVFGGSTLLSGGETNTGGVYDPVTDSWSTLPESGAPSPRRQHTAVWTGTEMIVWGGPDLDGTGARYNPATNTWTPTSTVDAPLGRRNHTAVWTGTEMVVWGGTDNFFPSTVQETGGRYDPATDSWTATSTASVPEAREEHTAVWTGTSMIVWGGRGAGGELNSGGVYKVASDEWTPTFLNTAPAARRYHVAVWTGTRMLVWGGSDNNGSLDSGGQYDLSTGTWTATTTVGAPSARIDATAVWSGSEMIVWGGSALRNTNDGGRYDPMADTWTPTSVGEAPMPRRGHTTVWTGSEVIVWGGTSGPQLDTGGRYDPALDTWSEVSTTGAPGGRVLHTAVWSGSEMIVWGGMGLGTNTGGRYDPVDDSWTPTSTTGAPEARRSHSAVWSGSEMIVWGGIFSPTRFDTGGRYDPSSDTWTPTSTISVPSARHDHTAVWSGSEMIVWGGTSDSGNEPTGGRYDPVADAWARITTTDAPTARVEHSAVWSGDEMIVWGGTGSGNPTLGDGGRYDPVLDAWSLFGAPEGAAAGAPSARRSHEAVWSGSEMIVWGGRVPGEAGLPDAFLNDGGRYDPATGGWTAVTIAGAPPGRHDFGVVWTGQELIVWGGANGSQAEVASGGRYCGCQSSTFYRDLDGDGFGDAGDTAEACNAPQGFVANPDDCNDSDGSIWFTPGEVVDARFADADTLSWSPPAQPGGASPVYDVIRSDDPTEFVAGTLCVSTDDPSTSATDTDDPLSPGDVFHYLVRAENGCTVGQGPAGDRSDGTPRSARNCP